MGDNFGKVSKGINLENLSGTPSNLSNGDIWYESGEFKFQQAGTTETLGSGAGGAGGINFVGLDTTWATATTDDRDAETTVGNWVAYADAAATIPVDMTGGSPTVTITRTTTAGEILNGAASFEFVKDAANRQGEGVSVVFNVPPAYQGKNATIKIPYKIVSGTVVSGDLYWYVYDVTNSILITPFNNSLIGSSGTIIATFPVTASASTPANIQMRLGLHVASTSALAMDIVFDDVTVEPSLAVYGAVATDWTSYSLTIGSTAGSSPTKGTIVRDEARWRRVGDSMEIEYNFSQSSAGSDTGVTGHYLWPLPSGYLIDTTKLSLAISESNVDSQCGVFKSSYAGTTIDHTGMVKAYDTSNLIAIIGNIYVGKQNNQYHISAQSNFQYSFFARVPISGWSSNVTLANSSTFQISSVIANGTRVTTAPAALGEYRTLIQSSVNAGSMSDTSPTQSQSAFSTDGMRIFSVTSATAAGTSGQPSKWEIFVGKNKTVTTQFWPDTAHSGYINSDVYYGRDTADTISKFGVHKIYNPTTGILIIESSEYGGYSNSGNYVGRAPVEGTGNQTNKTDCYFDVTVSENALAVGLESPRSEIWVYGGNGFGSTNTKSRRYTTVGLNIGSDITLTQSSTSGDSFTINSDGIYTAVAIDTRNGAGSTQFGISKNSSQLTTSIPSITITDVLTVAQCNSGDRSVNAVFTGKLVKGDVLRCHGDGSADATANIEVMFRITKISN